MRGRRRGGIGLLLGVVVAMYRMCEDSEEEKRRMRRRRREAGGMSALEAGLYSSGLR